MSLNQISQENAQIPSIGLINGSFKSLNVNGIPVGGGGGSGNLQTAYDNGNGIIELESSLTKPFIIQQTGGGNNLMSVNNGGVTFQEDVEIVGFSNSLKFERLTGASQILSVDGDNNPQNLTITAADLKLEGNTQIQCLDSNTLTIRPPTVGSFFQSLVSLGNGNVSFASTRLYNMTFAGNAVTGPHWLIPNGSGLTPSSATGTFATRFFSPHNLTGLTLAATREVTGGSTTSVSFYNVTAPATPIYVYTFPAGVGAEIVVPNLTFVAGETYTAIATDSVGNATVIMDLSFTID